MQRGVQWKVSDDVYVWQELFGRRSEPKIEQVATTLGRAAGAIKSRLAHLLGDHAAARRLSRVLDMREHDEAACNKHQPVAGTPNEGQYGTPRSCTATLRRSYTYTYTEAASVTGSVELYGSVYVCVEASTKKCELKYATQ